MNDRTAVPAMKVAVGNFDVARTSAVGSLNVVVAALEWLEVVAAEAKPAAAQSSDGNQIGHAQRNQCYRDVAAGRQDRKMPAVEHSFAAVLVHNHSSLAEMR